MCFFASMLLLLLCIFNVYFYFSAPNVGTSSAEGNNYYIGIKCQHERIAKDGMSPMFCYCTESPSNDGNVYGNWYCSNNCSSLIALNISRTGVPLGKGCLYTATTIGGSVQMPIERLKTIVGSGCGFKLTTKIGGVTKSFTEKSTNFTLSGYSASDFLFLEEDSGDNKYYILWIDFEKTYPTYAITCNNTGIGGTTTTSVTSVSTIEINAGTRIGYNFTGWTGDVTNSNTTFTLDCSTLSGDITLTANWVAQVYTITYNYTGDLKNADKLATDWGGKTVLTTHTYDAPTQLVLPSRAKYKFDGWYTSSNCTGTKLTSLNATGYTANIVLYGKWTRTQSTITINITVTGASGNGVILYLINGDTVQSQIVATSGKEIVLTQSVGENYSILVSKPYMWSMTVTGDCTQDTANKNKFSYTVSKTDANITLKFSGGASSSVIVI